MVLVLNKKHAKKNVVRDLEYRYKEAKELKGS